MQAKPLPVADNDDNELAFELNSELAKRLNDAIRLVDQSDPAQLHLYLAARFELFDFLDGIFLLMRDPDVTGAEVRAIASTTRKHFANALARMGRHLTKNNAHFVDGIRAKPRCALGHPTGFAKPTECVASPDLRASPAGPAPGGTLWRPAQALPIGGPPCKSRLFLVSKMR